MRTTQNLLATVGATALLLAAPALAQSTKSQSQSATQATGSQPQGAKGQSPQGQTMQGAGGEVARACLDELQQLAARMDDDGYWLTGWGSRWGYGIGPMGAPAAAGPRVSTAPVTPPADSATDQRERAQMDVAPDNRLGPWGPGTRYGIMAPSYQIRTLYAAANVLAHRNDQDGCEAVTAELKQLYNGYVQELRTAGIEPGAVRDWRVQQILLARPVEQIDRGAINIADITGTEVRSPGDQELGTVSDVLFDAKSGDISYVIVERGGFLGLGENHVAVPWKKLRATPNMGVLVLNASEEAMEQAPAVDPDRFANATVFAESRKQIDQYWDKRIGRQGDSAGQKPASQQPDKQQKKQ